MALCVWNPTYFFFKFDIERDSLKVSICIHGEAMLISSIIYIRKSKNYIKKKIGLVQIVFLARSYHVTSSHASLRQVF